jgi:hypothetical protein
MLIVIILPDAGLLTPGGGNRIKLGTFMQCLPACQIPNITTSTLTTTPSNARQFMAISKYGTCPSLPADGHRLILEPSVPSIPCHFAHKHQHHTPKITPTAARSFIVILDSKTYLLLSFPDYLHHEIAVLTPAIQSIFTQVGCTHVSIIVHGNANQLYLPILLAHKYAFLHVYFLYVHCLQATVILHEIPCQLKLTVLLLPPVVSCADSYSAPFSISDGALAMLGQPSYNRWMQATTPTSHASLSMSSPTSSLIITLL